MGNKLTTDSTKSTAIQGNNEVAGVPKEKTETNSLISFQTFGDHTAVPIQIRRAEFDLADPIPSLRRSLASLELTAVNTSVKRDVSGKFRISLPVGATVKKFEVLRCDPPSPPRWYPAVAVPKKTAKEVVYKEKEKGRDVAAFSDVATGSNVFEIEVSPLPFEQEVQFRLECMLFGEQLEDFRQLAGRYFQNDETEVVFAPEVDTERKQADLGEVGVAVVGEAFGKTHFVCHVPPLPQSNCGLATDGKCDINHFARIVIIWDSSLSMSKHFHLNKLRFERLRELADKCNERVCFELHTFCVGAAVFKGEFDTIDELISAIEAIEYDGGTDIASLPTLLSRLSGRQTTAGSTCNSEPVIIFTDGMDSLGSTPHFEEIPSVPFPVHVVADAVTVNLRCARALASASARYPGCVFTQSAESYVPGILYPRAILQSINTDQSDEAFVEEFDDGFRCVPDHRLQHLNEPVGTEGLLISGILGELDVCTVSKLVATVSIGNELHHFNFRLRDDSGPDANNKRAKKECDLEHTHHHYFCEAERPRPTNAANDGLGKSTKLSVPEDPSRLLGYLYSEAVYQAAEAFGFKSGIDLKGVREELSVEYGFCSPESSFLMLYSVEQFLENDVLPPRDHPAYYDERAIAERKKREKERDARSGIVEKRIAEGEIGGLKSDGQKEEVERLARDLGRYFSEHAPEGDTQSAAYMLEGDEECASQAAGADRFYSGLRSSPLLSLSAAPEISRASCRSFSRAQRSARGSGNVRRMMLSARMSAASPGERCTPTIDSLDRSMDFSSAEPASSSPLQEEEEDYLEDGNVEIYGDLGGRARHRRLSSARSLRCSAGGVNRRGASIRTDHSSVAPPQDPKKYEKSIEQELKSDRQGIAWKKAYQHERENLEGEVSPSFFLSCARLALKYDRKTDAIRIATNCLDMEIEDAQLLRCTAYFLLSCKCPEGRELALRLLGKVKEQQPCEPQSYLDLALAMFWELASCKRSGVISSSEKDELAKSIATVQELIARVLTHKWADRFDEIEWAALILLHYVADFTKELNEKFCFERKEETLPEWPSTRLAPFFQQKGASGDPLRCSKFDLALMVWLGWDTDHTDIDLHIIEPTKNEVYYSNRQSSIGGRLSRDFTDGLGPELFILKDRKPEGGGRSSLAGSYEVFAKYFASHQDSVLTGTTSALLWTIEKNRVEGGFGVVDFNTVRLDTHKEKTKIKTLQL